MGLQLVKGSSVGSLCALFPISTFVQSSLCRHCFCREVLDLVSRAAIPGVLWLLDMTFI